MKCLGSGRSVGTPTALTRLATGAAERTDEPVATSLGPAVTQANPCTLPWPMPQMYTSGRVAQRHDAGATSSGTPSPPWLEKPDNTGRYGLTTEKHHG